MIKATRECQVKGHHSSMPTKICIFKECNQFSRWCCAECIIDKLHFHGQVNENHLKKQEELIQFIKEYQNSYRTNSLKALLDDIIKKAKKLILSLSNLIQDYETYFDTLIKQAANDFLSINTEQINQIDDQNNKSLNLQESTDLLQGIFTSFQILQQLQQNSNSQQIQIEDNIQLQQYRSSNEEEKQAKEITQQQYLKYDYHYYFEQKEQYTIYTLQISPNEQLIAYGGSNEILTIINLQRRQIVKEIKIDNAFWTCQFSDDSNLIYSGDHKGYIYGYDINNNYKTIYKNQVHSRGISTICLIDSYKVVSCCIKCQIIVTDITNYKKLLIIPNAHFNWINQIKYDSINQVIISCSDDKSIKIYSQNRGDELIIQKNAHETEVKQIYFTNNNNNLLSSSFQELILWQIQYKQRKLIQIRIFVESESLLSFAWFLNDSRLVKFYSKYFIILDDNFNNIYQYNYKDDVQHRSFPNQSNSMNIILILGRNELKIIKRIKEFN